MKKILIIIVLIIGIACGLLVGNITSHKEILKEKDFDIYFSNLTTSLLHGDVFVPENPNIQSTSLKAYDVLITNPNDYATYTFDIINDGDYDAKLISINKMLPKCISLNIPENIEDEKLVCDNLEYKLFYTKNNKEVKINDIIKSHTKENVTIKVGYVGKNILTSKEGVQITLYDMNLKYSKVK